VSRQQIASYSTSEVLRNGRCIEIRALRLEDKDDLLAAVRRAGSQSMFRRFFAAKRDFSNQEVAFFLNINFVTHVALIAVAEEGGRPAIVGGGRYIISDPGKAEVAFVIIDEYQGQGIGSILLRHLTAIARNADVKEFTAEILPENRPMLKVFEKSGLDFTTTREPGVVHMVLRLS
jgi:RimJ/RimL family protein N-acetyltransferase